MSRASEAARKAYPEDWEAGYFDDPDEVTDDNEEAREFFQQGYEQAEKDIISLIESRIGEILGDAQPAPVLRAELQEMINKIKKQ